MKQPESFDYTPQFGHIIKLVERGIDANQIRLTYNEDADELVVFIISDTEHTVALDISDNAYLLLDPETEEVVGYQFDNFLAQVVIERPQLVSLASLAGVEQSLVAQARERIGESRLRQAEVESALRDMLAASPTGR